MMIESCAKYDPTKSYLWNYEHAPEVDRDWPRQTAAIDVSQSPWRFCGRKVASPLGMPAGPLLNGKWVLHYASLGFDILTYKTVRSRHRDCYPLPNLQPIRESSVLSGGEATCAERMQSSWAISFGMPSMEPDIWRKDVRWTRERLPAHKLLCVSVVATAEPDWDLHQVAADYARCALWAAESGADAVELNFSCPNVSTVDGQLYQDPMATRQVLQTVRDGVPDHPLLVKIGHMSDERDISNLLDACSGLASGLSMTNCLACRVKNGQEFAFQGELRGIGGEAIRDSSVAQVQQFAYAIQRKGLTLSLVGVGGIARLEHVQDYLRAGAESVQIATAAMLDPGLGLALQQQMPRLG